MIGCSCHPLWRENVRGDRHAPDCFWDFSGRWRRFRLRWQRCGHCGRRDPKHRVFTSAFRATWTTCRQCQEAHPYRLWGEGADGPTVPPYARLR